ncbi:hypothetical protein DFH06DRAFT_1326006 [Mycena polygramma]|nr:hypothetical protein DFH06DRAFT_1333764 [Mycena polygramma]KAJ7660741.1 hypothetical protein DFH06DRAFT_1326006 [Mycena polygramma]
MVLADLAVATTAVSDAAAAVEASAAVFLAPVLPVAASTLFRTTGPWIAGYLYTVIPAERLAAIPDNNDKWFAITSGKYVGLTKNAALSLNAVVGVSNALSTSFNNQADALDHFNSALDGGAIAIVLDDGFDNSRAQPSLSFPSHHHHLPMPSSPPPYPASDFDTLLNSFRRLDLASGSSTSSSSTRETLYRVETPTKLRYTSHWDEAAQLSQGVPAARATRIARKPKSRSTKKAYVVFFGRIPGVYKTWAEARVQVDGAGGNIHQGYPSEETGLAAFEYARERGWVGVCTSRPPSPRPVPVSTPIPSLPEPVGLADTPNPLHTGHNGPASSGSRWYVVYSGVLPGVYQSSLECALNICGIPNAVHDAWDSRAVAVAKYQNALNAGRVEVISPPYAPLP